MCCLARKAMIGYRIGKGKGALAAVENQLAPQGQVLPKQHSLAHEPRSRCAHTFRPLVERYAVLLGRRVIDAPMHAVLPAALDTGRTHMGQPAGGQEACKKAP